MENNEEQIIEVEYDSPKVEEYKQNYIMEEEGIGAFDGAEPYDQQTNFNENLSFSDINEEGEVIVEEVAEDDSNN